MVYRRKKNDLNQREIVKGLLKIPGLKVELDHDDILVGYKGFTYWYELKNQDEVDKNGKPYDKSSSTAKKQKKIQDEFTGHYKIVSTLEEILLDMGLVT